MCGIFKSTKRRHIIKMLKATLKQNLPFFCGEMYAVICLYMYSGYSTGEWATHRYKHISNKWKEKQNDNRMYLCLFRHWINVEWHFSREVQQPFVCNKCRWSTQLHFNQPNRRILCFVWFVEKKEQKNNFWRRFLSLFPYCLWNSIDSISKQI